MKPDSLLLRQVHPGMVSLGEPSLQVFEVTSSVFEPRKSDEGMLSVYNGEKFEASAAHSHYRKQGLESFGVLAVTVSECELLMLTAAEDNNPFDGHAHINFNGLPSKGAWRRAAAKLRDLAVARGWQFRKEE